MQSFEYLKTPIGVLRIAADDTALREVRRFRANPTEPAAPNALTRAAAAQLTEYFAGTRKTFDLPLSPQGTAFQHRVWEVLAQIPWGGTTCYQELAEKAGRRGAARAVGNAVGANPLLILIPCHRVFRTDGALGGYSAGLDAKRALLRLEGITWRE